MNAKASSSRNVGQGAAAAAAAWNLDEADDPADWNESFRFLRDLDATLRCDLCYVRENNVYPSSSMYTLYADIASPRRLV